MKGCTCVGQEFAAGAAVPMVPMEAVEANTSMKE